VEKGRKRRRCRRRGNEELAWFLDSQSRSRIVVRHESGGGGLRPAGRAVWCGAGAATAATVVVVVTVRLRDLYRDRETGEV